MDIIILNNSEKPIYEQIKDQIKTMIFAGELKKRRCASVYAGAGEGIKNQYYYDEAGV